jgi:hypothetical protein
MAKLANAATSSGCAHLCIAASMAVMLLAGCSANYQLLPDTTPEPGVAMQGRVFGGQQPVAGSKIGLYAAGSTGYGAGAKQLLTIPVFSGADGSFTLTNEYTCPSATSEIYLTAQGGDPGLGGTTDNSAIFLVAALGPCGALTSTTSFSVNEASTVAAAFALAQFTNVKTEIVGSSASNSVGLQTAFSTVNSLVNLTTGTPLTKTPGGNGIVPQGEIDTLADALSACVNTAGPESDGCSTLLYNATPPTLDVAQDTFQAALYIALYPGNDILDIFPLATPQSPFQPVMAKAPNDWTMGITYSGASLNYPDGLEIDSLGNVWVISASLYGSSITELSPLGALKSPALEGYDIGSASVGPAALDAAGDLWMATVNADGNGTSGVIELNSKGAMISPNDLNGVGFAQNKFLFPQAVAIDSSSNVWIVDGTILVELDKTGKIISPTATPAGSLVKGFQFSTNINSSASDIAIDGMDNVWIANGGLDSIAEVDKDGAVQSPDDGFSGGGLDGQAFGLNSPSSIAIDGQGFIWTANTNAGDVSEFRNTGVPLSPPTGYTNGGINDPQSIAVDGAGDMWFTNPQLNSVSELNPSAFAISPFDGYGGAGFNGPNGIGIDPSGNVWVANFAAGFNGTVTEMIGAAVPTVTPITPSQIGSEP